MRPGSCEHQLAHRARPRESAETEGHKRRETAHAREDADHDDHDTGPCRDREAAAKHTRGRLAPRERRRHRHEEQKCEADRKGHRVEVGPSDRDLLAVHRLDKEREDRSEEHDEREPGEKEVVHEERTLPRHRGVDRPRRAQAVTTPGDKPDTDGDHETEETQQDRADRRVREGVHRHEHSRAGEECPENGERERRGQK